MNIIFNFLNTILNQIFSITGDWGVTIILLTLLVRTMLLPLSIKQKNSIYQQQDFYKKLEELKTKYKNNSSKLEEETKKLYTENGKSMLGCMVSLLQLPIIASLYSVFMSMPVGVGSMLIPWMANIKLPDNTFIIPALYTLASLSPNLINNIKWLKPVVETKISKANIIIMAVFSLLITIKAPIAIGMYFLTSSVYSFVEEVGYRLYIRNKKLALAK